ncbi:MAG: FAD-binding oxidoreductase [Rhodobacteraceae bacterium]|nr:FAD-binding oxidoreductase [Paracoccaceae bacterium]
MAMVDVTVRGAGVFGLSIAFACATRGASVCVVDPNGAGSGSSGGLVGALAPHVPENWNAKKAFQFEALMMAEGFWRDVSEKGGVSPGYARTGRLQPIADATALALAHKRSETATDLWQGKAEWHVRPAKAFGDWSPPSATGYVIHDTLSARMHPRQACAALVAALKSLNVDVVAQAPDRGAVIHATGAAGLATISLELGKAFGAGIKGQSALMQYDARDAPQVFAETLHFVPHADGTLGIGSTTERAFDDPQATDHLLDDVIERARMVMPVLRDAKVIARWAAVRPRAKSRAPVLGPYPGRPGHFIANGGFKIGFGVAPKVAQAMADLVLAGQDTIPDAFRVETCL